MIKRLMRKIQNRFNKDFFETFDTVVPRSDPATQTTLTFLYKQIVESGKPLPSFKEVGWKAYSQTDEDGILHYLFSILGTTNKKCVEICAGDARECNTINLLLNHAWAGLLVDGNAANVEKGKKWLSKHRNTYVYPPAFVSKWITQSNINTLLEENGFANEIDLLSIDVDGVDYWLWKALTTARPRVVVIEYQQHLGPNHSWTVPYSDNFSAWDHPVSDGWLPNYAGASLKALTKLADEKGYRLVGCNAYCFNAFFVRNDVGAGLIPSVPVESCFSHPRAQRSIKERFATVANMNWIEV